MHLSLAPGRICVECRKRIARVVSITDVSSEARDPHADHTRPHLCAFLLAPTASRTFAFDFFYRFFVAFCFLCTMHIAFIFRSLVLLFFIASPLLFFFFFFLNDTAPPEIYPLPLPDPLPI